jgi:N-acetylmuramoyl-L-alanine amidase
MLKQFMMAAALAAPMCVAANAANPAAPVSAEATYLDAMAKEGAVISALGEGRTGSAAMLKAVREVVSDYENFVRRFPTSPYCEDALWRGGRLSLDAFRRFSEPVDRETGLRLIRTLRDQYPRTRFITQARNILDEMKSPGTAETAALPAPKAAATSRKAASSQKPAEAAAESTTAARPLATIQEIRRTVLSDVVRITIELDAEVPFHDERLDNPNRVFVDLRSTRAAPALRDRTLRFDGDADPVHQVRLGRHPDNTTRVVLDTIDVSTYTVYQLYNPYRLVIDCARQRAVQPNTAAATARTVASTSGGESTDGIRTAIFADVSVGARSRASVAPAKSGAVQSTSTDTTEPTALPRSPLRARAFDPAWSRGLPSVSPRASAALLHPAPLLPPAPAAGEPDTPAPATAPARPSTSAGAPVDPPRKNVSGGFSISRQLGLRVSKVVIDPGHGGRDSGAIGKGVTEAELVLDVAQRLEKLLTDAGTDVVMTRRADEFVNLQQRTAIANRENADLFLSIHANASNLTQARGVESYFLNFASNLGAAAVAARENAASGQAMAALPDFVKAIALNNKVAESRDLASELQRSLIDKLGGSNKTVRNLGVKQAPFVVLIGAAMPSVLTEISFITNAQEAKLLKSSAYRQRIADGLFNGIRKYQASLNRAPAVAQRPASDQ